MFIRLLSACIDRARASADRGAVAGEYAVILGLVTVALITVIGLFTGALVNAFNAAIGVLPGGATP